MNRLKLSSRIPRLFFFTVTLLIIGSFVHSPGQGSTDLRRQIASLLMFGFVGGDAQQISPYLKQGMAGVILFEVNGNLKNPSQVKALTAQLRAIGGEDLLIAVDQEGGPFNHQLKVENGFFSGTAGIPSHQELGRRTTQDTLAVARTVAQELKSHGLNLNFAPVVDVNVHSENPIIGSRGRAFSEDPLEVANHARAFVQGHREQKILTCLKHFPGHGSSRDDSHKGFTDITDTWRSKSELSPYEILVKENVVDSVMVAHVTHRGIDSVPATLSPRFVFDLLRSAIGFDGVVISDDLLMGAITQNFALRDTLVKTLNAGVDILLFTFAESVWPDSETGKAVPINPTIVVDTIADAVASGAISRDKIEAAYSRVQALKRRIAPDASRH